MAALTDYRTRLSMEPLTRNQLGAIHREFYRLGFHVSADRAERLRITAALARFPGALASTKDLTMGEAGRVVGLMSGCGTARDLYALAEPEPEPRAAVPAGTIAQAFAMFLIAWNAAKSGPVPERREVAGP